ncbi:hypothetical protein DOT_1533 [Desulfosporosinus sp. OT]|nr:hypothetical protein DOT_1533 [Desulfosporosinus sp. OT]
MAKCRKCGVEVSEKDLYEDHGLQVCEDCKMRNAVSPPESCATRKNMIK